MTKAVTLELKTKYHFGPNVVLDQLPNELKNYQAKNVLLLYGGGSIKKNGLYQHILFASKKAKVKIFEFAGIEPNPRDETVYQASIFARKHKIDLIIAAGGGSVIDASKVVAILANNPQYPTTKAYIDNPNKIKKSALPIFAIVTLAATGSENNAGSVITIVKTKQKLPVFTPSAIPSVAFEDPNYTMTLSKWQTACGIFDIFSHLLEQVYDSNPFDWSTYFHLGQMKTLVKNAKLVFINPKNYDARANILWTSTFALNALGKFNNGGGDWKVHGLEHGVSGLWDVAHGAGLALITPTYVKYMNDQSELFRQQSLLVAKEVFGVKTLKKYDKKLRQFIAFLKLPQKWSDFDNIKEVSKADLDFLIKHFAARNNIKDASKFAQTIYSKIPK